MQLYWTEVISHVITFDIRNQMLWHPCLTVLISLDGVENLQRSLLDNHQYCTVIVYDSLILCYIAHILSVFCVFITYLFTLQWNLPQTKFLLSYSESCLKLNPFYPTMEAASKWTPFILLWNLPQTVPMLSYSKNCLKLNPFILLWNLPQTEPLLSYSETYLKLKPFYPTVKAASNWTLFTLQWKLTQNKPFYPTVKPTSNWTPFILQWNLPQTEPFLS